MKLALAQLRMKERWEDNLASAFAAIQHSAEGGADLVLFPEVQFSPFFPREAGRDASPYLMTLDHPAVLALRDSCRRHHVWASPNLYLAEGGKRYDASLLIDDAGQVRGISKMVHIAQAPRFYEQDYYTPSDTGFPVYDTPFGRIGIVICFDRHYPESIRTEALAGAELILIPTANITDEPEELFQWEVRVQAFQNSVAVAMCNRVGPEGDVTFSGGSLVSDAEGCLTALAGGEETLLFADIDLARSSQLRDGRPYTSLRRPEWYR